MKKLNENPIIVLIPVIAAICAIIYFCTNENLPGIISRIININAPPTNSDSDSSNKPDEYSLDGTIMHVPNFEKEDYIVGGIWKLQGIHEDADSFSQSVKVWFNDDSQTVYPGYVKYGTVWTEDTTGNWEETLEEFDELAHYDYPKGTYGTFVVDMTNVETVPFGDYICELTVVINQEPYTIQLPFSLEG